MAYEIDISSETAKVASDLQNDQAMFVVDAATNTIKLIAKDSAGDQITIPFGGGVKRFVANLTQSAGAAPVATILVNDMGEVPTFARTSAGLYTCTFIAAVLTALKTAVRFGTPIHVNTLGTVEAVLTSTTVITFTTIDYKTSDDTSAPLDGMLTNTSFVIEVYA